MNNKIIFILLLFSTIGTAQKNIKKITAGMLEQQVHAIDSTAEAAYLSKTVRIYYNFDAPSGIELELTHKYFVQVFKEKGEQYGNITIPYYHQSSENERITNIKGTTYNLENGKVVKTKLNKKDIYREKSSANWSLVKFAMPNVKPGSIIEIQYSKSSPFIYSIPKWYFQNYIPTDYSCLTIDVPSYFSLTPIASGTFPLEREINPLSISNHNEKQFIFSGSNFLAIKKDKYVLNENDYRSSLKYELKSTNFPNNGVRYFSKDWNTIAQNLTKNKSFGGQIKKKLKELQPIIDEAKALEENERIQFLYQYVRTNYSWNTNYGRTSPEGLKTVVKNKSGSVSDLNLLLINLLRKCDVECYPLLLKSRNSGILNASYPSLTELNYLIVYIPRDDEYQLADASSFHSPIGELPVRAINTKGLIVKKEVGVILEIKNTNKYRLDLMGKYEININENYLFGTAVQKRSGYAATKYRMDLENKESAEMQENDPEQDSQDSQETDLESEDLENEISNVEVENITEIGKPIKLAYDEKLFDATKILDDKIFIDATLDFGITKNPFIEEFRDKPIFFQNTIQLRYIAQIKIPDGYQVEKLPQTNKLAIDKSKASFQYQVSQLENTLTINYLFSIKDPLIFDYEYPGLHEFYQLVIKKGKDKIILAKK